MSRDWRRGLAALAAAALLCAGCDKLSPASSTPFQGIDVTGSKLGADLRLTDPHGAVRTLQDFRGKLVVVTFGFTHCPDICPTTLAALAKAMAQLGNDARQVQVLFVTVDPKRDTPELLAQYVPAFHPDFLPLRGDADATAKATKSFGIYASERAGKTESTYTVDHSAQLFVFDREGRVRLVWAPGVAPEAMVSDLRLLLKS